MSHDLPALGIVPDTHPGARIRMGLKGERGGVVERDRFHIALFRAPGSGMSARSVPHPEFTAFNRIPEFVHDPSRYSHLKAWEAEEARKQDHAAYVAREVETRRLIRGVLVHGQFESPDRTGGGCCWTRYVAQQLPRHDRNRENRPTCSGDGRTARRFVDGAWKDIICPGDKCQYRQERDEKGQAIMDCKRSSTLVFQLRWRTNKLPCETAMIETSGMWSFATMQWWGFYENIRRQWETIIGPGEPDVYSLPIRLMLTERSVTGRQAKVWVPELHPDLPDGMSLQSFLSWRAGEIGAARQLLGSDGVRLALPDYGAVDAADAVVERP